MKLEILTGHLTERIKILILSLRNIILSSKIITFSLLILILSLVNIINTSALSYESNVGVGFTFDPILSISLSSADLVISNLTPGTTADSNDITISVATNVAYGYALSATTNNENLVRSDNVDSTFSSISTNANLETLVMDNTWGYSYKLSNGSGGNNNTWSNYNGLSTSTNATLINANNQTSKPIDFKISAKASSTQPSGVYTGTITFVVVTKPTPMNLAESYFAHGKSKYKGYYTMQDMNTEICNDTEVIGEGSQTELIDIRDDKVYWTTKLADNHCWMTQNLDLDLSHDTPLTSETTDLNDSSLSGAYSENYTYNSENEIITWTPKKTIKNYIDKTGSWGVSYSAAYSFEPGDWYWDGDDESEECNYLTTICENFSQVPFSNMGTHGHVGNYYNWPAAIASDDSSIFSNDTFDNISNNPQNSICPKGWRLPTISSSSSLSVNSTNEFARLNFLYNDSSRNDAGLIGEPLYLVRSSALGSSANLQNINKGWYWSSTNNSSNLARYLFIEQKNNTTPAANYVKYIGGSIRCLAR